MSEALVYRCQAPTRCLQGYLGYETLCSDIGRCPFSSIKKTRAKTGRSPFSSIKKTHESGRYPFS